MISKSVTDSVTQKALIRILHRTAWIFYGVCLFITVKRSEESYLFWGLAGFTFMQVLILFLECVAGKDDGHDKRQE